MTLCGCVRLFFLPARSREQDSGSTSNSRAHVQAAIMLTMPPTQSFSRFWSRWFTAPAPSVAVNSFVAALFKPVDISFLVYLRIIFGAIMLWEVYR